MYLSEIKIENFKCFENIQIPFDRQMNVIVGNNGMGKSSLLDAVRIGIGAFFHGIDSMFLHSPIIDDRNVRFVNFNIGSVIDRQPQYPANISCNGTLNGNNLIWNIKKEYMYVYQNTYYEDTGAITEAVSSIQQAVGKGDKNVSLPLLSYYGTERSFQLNKYRDYKEQYDFSNRFKGYENSLDSFIDEEQMTQWIKKMTFQELQDGEKIPEFTAVKQAMAECFKSSCSTVDDFNVRFGLKNDDIEIFYIDDAGKRQMQLFSELSDGFRNTLGLVADIAYRMAVLNPQYLENVTKKTEGIVLIDEIDQHLHPKWQRNIISSLMSIFPKIQFIVTTHSPNVIASVKRGKVIMLNRNEWYVYNNVYGKDTNSVLSEIMDVNSRPDEVANLFSEFYDCLNDEDYIKAEELLNKLAEIIGESDSEYVSARVALDFEKAADDF